MRFQRAMGMCSFASLATDFACKARYLIKNWELCFAAMGNVLRHYELREGWAAGVI